MNIVLAVAEVYVPGFIKRRKLREMFALTAEAFGAEPPLVKGLSYPELLTVYARFSSEQAKRLQASERAWNEARRKLADLARAFGLRLRRQFRVRTKAEALRLAKLIYRLTGIEMTPTSDGEFIITHCFFRNYYSSETCRLMSGLDEGMLTSLSGCRELHFNRRLTEDHSECRAQLS